MNPVAPNLPQNPIPLQSPIQPLMPTIIIPPPENPDNPPPEKKEFKILEKLLEVNILLTIFFGAVILTVIFLFVTGKINLEMIFGKPKETTPLAQTITPKPTITTEVEIEPVYINEQVIDVEKAFKTPADKLKLIITGKLKKEVLGFLPYWSVDEALEINTKLLTSVSYFGLEVDGAGNIIKTGSDGKAIEAWLRWENDPKLDVFIKNAKKNRIKIYLTLKSFDNGNIEKLVRSQDAIDNFVKNAIYQVNSHSIDGLNLDFEYVGTPPENVRDGFSILVATLNNELKRQYPKSVLTVDTYINAAATPKFFNIDMLAKNCDALVVMGYDFHTPQSAKAGSLAPMEGYGISVLEYMTKYLEQVPPEKLILAVGYYGYDWPVNDASVNSDVTGTKGDVNILPFAEIMDATKKTTINWDEKAQTPWYSYKDSSGQTRVVHFENSRSLGIKYDYVNENNLQGMGIWALGYDGKNTELLQLISDKFTK